MFLVPCVISLEEELLLQELALATGTCAMGQTPRMLSLGPSGGSHMRRNSCLLVSPAWEVMSGGWHDGGLPRLAHLGLSWQGPSLFNGEHQNPQSLQGATEPRRVAIFSLQLLGISSGALTVLSYVD